MSGLHVQSLYSSPSRPRDLTCEALPGNGTPGSKARGQDAVYDMAVNAPRMAFCWKRRTLLLNTQSTDAGYDTNKHCAVPPVPAATLATHARNVNTARPDRLDLLLFCASASSSSAARGALCVLACNQQNRIVHTVTGIISSMGVTCCGDRYECMHAVRGLRRRSDAATEAILFKLSPPFPPGLLRCPVRARVVCHTA